MSADPTGHGAPRARVLVVDDDDAVRTVLAGALEDEGFRVVEATDGREALAALMEPRAPVDVVLLDLMMPNVSGWRVLGALPRMAGPRPAIIVVTALDPAHLRLPAADAIVRKPFVLEELLAAVSGSTEPSSGSATGTV